MSIAKNELSRGRTLSRLMPREKPKKTNNNICETQA